MARRSAAPAITLANVPPIAATPAAADAITFSGSTLTIPGKAALSQERGLSPQIIRLALPPAAAVFTDTTRSMSSRSTKSRHSPSALKPWR